MKMGRNDQVQCPSKGEESSSPTSPPSGTDVDFKQGQGFPGKCSVSCDTHSGRAISLTLFGRRQIPLKEAIAEATSLITVSCEFLHQSYSREPVSVKGKGAGPLKVLAIWKWTTSSQGKYMTFQESTAGMGWGPGGPGLGVRRPSSAFPGAGRWQGNSSCSLGINFFLLTFYYEEFNS